jgi:hypothetical protein
MNLHIEQQRSKSQEQIIFKQLEYFKIQDKKN